jgi:hypothetical protein
MGKFKLSKNAMLKKPSSIQQRALPGSTLTFFYQHQNKNQILQLSKSIHCDKPETQKMAGFNLENPYQKDISILLFLHQKAIRQKTFLASLKDDFIDSDDETSDDHRSTENLQDDTAPIPPTHFAPKSPNNRKNYAETASSASIEMEELTLPPPKYSTSPDLSQRRKRSSTLRSEDDFITNTRCFT